MLLKGAIQPKYEDGTVRSEIKFAIWKRIGDKILLFHRYEVVYVYSKQVIKANVMGELGEFTVYSWLKVKESAF